MPNSFGVRKLIIEAATGVIAVAAILFGVNYYGERKFNQGRQQSEIARVDSTRRILVQALDSAHKAMIPAFDKLVAENASLRDANRIARDRTFDAAQRAHRAEETAGHLSDSLMHLTPPEVRASMDSLVASSAALRLDVDHLSGVNDLLVRQNDSLLVSVNDWKSLYEKARVTIDTSAKEIAMLKAQKAPSKCGFKCGLVVGVLTATAAGVTIAVVGH